MRSSQIETLLGATRLGVRAMLPALNEIGVLDRSTLCGVSLFSASLLTRLAPSDVEERGADFAFSDTALDEYNASMADIDALLARSGVERGHEGTSDAD